VERKATREAREVIANDGWIDNNEATALAAYSLA
jgi:hypothetical protein